MTRPVLGITPARVGYRELRDAMDRESPEAATGDPAGRDSGDTTPKPRTGHPRPPQSKTAAGAESERNQ